MWNLRHKMIAKSLLKIANYLWWLVMVTAMMKPTIYTVDSMVVTAAILVSAKYFAEIVNV